MAAHNSLESKAVLAVFLACLLSTPVLADELRAFTNFNGERESEFFPGEKLDVVGFANYSGAEARVMVCRLRGDVQQGVVDLPSRKAVVSFILLPGSLSAPGNYTISCDILIESSQEKAASANTSFLLLPHLRFNNLPFPVHEQEVSPGEPFSFVSNQTTLYDRGTLHYSWTAVLLDESGTLIQAKHGMGEDAPGTLASNNSHEVPLVDEDGDPLLPGNYVWKGSAVVSLPNGMNATYAYETEEFRVVREDAVPLFYLLGAGALAVLLAVAVAAFFFTRSKAPGSGQEVSVTELLSGSRSILVEGPVGAKAEEFIHSKLIAHAMQSGKCAVLTVSPKSEKQAFPLGDSLKLVEVDPETTDISIKLSTELRDGAKLVYLAALNQLVPAYKGSDISRFLTDNIRKAEQSGSTLVCFMDPSITSKDTVTVIERQFDVVMEFKLVEERVRLVSYYRVKQFKGKKFSTELVRYA